MKAHSEFSYDNTLFFGGAQIWLSPESCVRNLIDYSLHHGPQAAIDWYRRVLQKKEAAIRHCAIISGFGLEREFVFSNGVILRPVEEYAGPQQTVGWVKQVSEFNRSYLGGFSLLSIATEDAIEPLAPNISPEGRLAFLDNVRDVLFGSTLGDDLAPSVIFSWSDLADDDLLCAVNSFIAGGSPQEASLHAGRVLNRTDQDRIETFLALEPALRRILSIPLYRLGLARRRANYANIAIELCIALESLLADGNAEMTHKIATRGALLLGDSFEERRDIQKKLKKLYHLRSSAVHGKEVDDINFRELVEEMEQTVAAIIWKLVGLGKRIDLSELDLNGP